MQYYRHIDFEEDRFIPVYALYESSFPENERRTSEDQRAAMLNEAYHCESIWEGTQFIGLIFYWRHEAFCYVEHFAIFRDLQGQQWGSRCLDAFCQRTGSVILEIEPPVDMMTIRRQHFYERAGFIANDYDYRHLAYRHAYPPHALVIMSYPAKISAECFAAFNAFLRSVVMQYAQPKYE